MNTNTYVTLAFSTMLATACSTHNSHKNQEVAQYGLTYAETANKLLTQAMETITDVNSKVLLHIRDSQNSSEMLKKQNYEILEARKGMITFQKSISNTKDYYQALALLIEDPSRESVSNSIEEISATIGIENQVNSLTYGSASKISRITNMTIDAHYSKRIQRILRRDAPIIENQLKLQKKQLKKIVALYEKQLKTESSIYYKENVEAVYFSPNPLAAKAFVENRRHWFEMDKTAPGLEELSKAHKNIHKAWKAVQLGNSNLTSINYMLLDTNKLATAIEGLPEPSNELNPVVPITINTL